MPFTLTETFPYNLTTDKDELLVLVSPVSAPEMAISYDGFVPPTWNTLGTLYKLLEDPVIGLSIVEFQTWQSGFAQLPQWVNADLPYRVGIRPVPWLPSGDILLYESFGALAETLQLEDGVLVGCGVGTFVPGFNGSGFVRDLNQDGDSVTVTVNAPLSQSVECVLRFNTINDATLGYFRTLGLYVDGVRVRQLQLQGGPTPSTWATATFDVFLPAGATSLRFQQDAGDTGRARLDQIQLTSL